MTAKHAAGELLEAAITALEAVAELDKQPDEVELKEDIAREVLEVHVALTHLMSTFAHAPEDTWLCLAKVFEKGE